MAWIKSDQTLRQHPKLRRFMRELSLDKPKAIGYLHMLWWWVMDYAPDGDVSLFRSDEIADGAEWPDDPDQFCAALKVSRFLDEDGMVHDWMEFSGQLHVSRAGAAKRQKDFRIRHGLTKAPAAPAVPPGAPPLQNGQHPASSMSAMEIVKSRLCLLYARPSNQALTYAEESGIFEICRRDGVLNELGLIEKLKGNSKYFPQSMSKLLSGWSEALDRARIDPASLPPEKPTEVRGITDRILAGEATKEEIDEHRRREKERHDRDFGIIPPPPRVT